MRIPADEREAFHREFLPTLTRAVPFLTPDPALALPKVRSPYLVFEAHFDDEISHDALLNWYWEYPKNPLDEEGTDSGVRRLPALGLDTERDERFEARVLRAVRSATASNPVLAGGFGDAALRDGKPAIFSLMCYPPCGVFPGFACGCSVL